VKKLADTTDAKKMIQQNTEKHPSYHLFETILENVDYGDSKSNQKYIVGINSNEVIVFPQEKYNSFSTINGENVVIPLLSSTQPQVSQLGCRCYKLDGINLEFSEYSCATSGPCNESDFCGIGWNDCISATVFHK
jgi:hypothetical protein